MKATAYRAIVGRSVATVPLSIQQAILMLAMVAQVQAAAELLLATGVEGLELVLVVILQAANPLAEVVEVIQQEVIRVELLQLLVSAFATIGQVQQQSHLRILLHLRVRQLRNLYPTHSLFEFLDGRDQQKRQGQPVLSLIHI